MLTPKNCAVTHKKRIALDNAGGWPLYKEMAELYPRVYKRRAATRCKHCGRLIVLDQCNGGAYEWCHNGCPQYKFI